MTGILTNRAVILIEPTKDDEDVRAFLQGLVTNDMTQVGEQQPIYAALLTAQGKMAFDFFIRVYIGQFGVGFVIDCEKETAADLVKRLSLYRLRRAISIKIDDLLCITWTPPWEDNPDRVDDPRLPALGKRSFAPSGPPPSIQPKPIDAEYLAHRLSLGVPEGRAEMGDILWLETNAAELNGVSFTKGCYVGQENTARMNWRQKINRRLIVVPLEASQEKRRKASYPELGLAVDHLRVADIAPEFLPDWLDLNAGESEPPANI